MRRLVLIVEDQEHSAAPLEIALSGIAGIDVLLLPNARDALRLLRDRGKEIVAIVTDLHLPYMDGFELIEAIRGHGKLTGLPIIVVSADTHPDTPSRLALLGANAYFPKPYSPAKIRKALEGLLAS
jgi:DNA-binding response OmpR family regulator